MKAYVYVEGSDSGFGPMWKPPTKVFLDYESAIGPLLKTHKVGPKLAKVWINNIEYPCGGLRVTLTNEEGIRSIITGWSESGKSLGEYKAIYIIDVTENASAEQTRIESEAAARAQNRFYDMSIDELWIPIVGHNRLREHRIATIGDLCRRSPLELLEIHGFGKRSLQAVVRELAKGDLALRDPGPKS